MYLKKIFLTNFRNFSQRDFRFSPGLTFVLGKNSQGKTNLLEGINLLLKGTGFRDSKEEELIKLGSTEASVEGELGIDGQNSTYRIDLIKKAIALEKNYYLDRTKKHRGVYLKEVISAVLFSPEQIEIIIGPPGIRRDYFDKFLSATDSYYKNKLNNYNQALRKRNKVLETIHDRNKLEEQLLFWNEYLEENANYIIQKREEYTTFLNKHKKVDSKIFSMIYKKNIFDSKKAKEYLSKEMRTRKTLIGPQRDVFQIFLADLDVNLFGSRSEERLALFWLKLNELKYWENLTKKKPILLLDDIFSELDFDNQKLVLNLINDYQTVATSTNKSLLSLVKFPNDSSHYTIYL